MTLKTPLALASALALTLSGCVTATDGGPNRTANGAIIGGLAGAALGGIASDGDLEKAVIGGALGAGIGAAVGQELDRQAADLRNQLGDDRITVTNTGEQLIVSMPQDILFSTDSASLRADLQGDLRALGRNLLQYPDTTVQVIGHTDSEGSAAYNQDLSERRARAVSGVLLETGVSGARIRSFGRGESQPIATNNTPEGRQQNRRVDIIITPNA
ncbi:OmpA family protein [Jannaschia sp. 2305UL9-9]|uniref:OmpA family protein n=1 Tax=Jannaschia sp. 2305UL9-9 TaxID=3121638 RepID=UPI0035288D7D